MTPAEFKAWMKKQDLRVVDVAHFTKLDLNTIYAFRRGDPVNRVTRDVIYRFVAEYQPPETTSPTFKRVATDR